MTKMKVNMIHKQMGVTLVTGLIFLVVLTLLGVTAMKTATTEERMSSNLRDRNLSLQAAEMTLRYAEQHIRDNDPATNTPTPIDGITGFDAACTGGYCYYGKGNEPTSDVRSTYCTPVCPISYTVGTDFNFGASSYTAPALPAGIIQPPTYIIEAIEKIKPGDIVPIHYYRITVRALGAKPGTVVWLQEVFRP